MEKKPTFFWQAALILLPVLLLVAVGIYSLRQDKTLAEAEAKERAQSYADELQHHISSVLAARAPSAFTAVTVNNDTIPMFVVSTNGSLIYPPTETAPAPSALAIDQLSAEQHKLWVAATSAEFSTNHATAVGAYRNFLHSNPPDNFAACARYSLALLLGASDEAKNLLTQVEATKATSDAGFPIGLLAQIKQTELDFSSTNQERKTGVPALISLCSEAVAHRTLLTDPIFELAQRVAPGDTTIQQLKKQLENERLAQELYTIAVKSLMSGPRALVVDADEPYLLFSEPQSSQIRVACYRLSDIVQDVDGILSSVASAPAYFGFNVQLAGRELATLNAKPWREESHFSPRGSPPGTVTKKEYLVTTNAIAPVFAIATGSGATDTLKINVVLTNRDALFKRQQARRNWFGTLILISAVVAGSGLWRSWRTFTRQQQLNEMKSNFVSSVSHELRAPIASVRLLAEALDRGAVPEQPKQKEYFRFIVQECRRLTGLIENVLDFSRIEQGRKQYQFEETDLNALVDQTIKLMQPAAIERGVELQRSEFNVQCSVFNVVCDGLAIQQALVNLIDNAIKHSPAGQTVVVEMKDEHRTSNIEHRTSNEAPPLTIHLTVTDHGPGIPPEDHQKIFERFYRRGSELRRETQGIGIGLTIVKHVAEAHGGRVLVESAVGKGSKFTIELPVHQPK